MHAGGMSSALVLEPRLVVRDAAAAIEFYIAAFDAHEIERFTSPEGQVVHAAVKIGAIRLSLTDEDRAFNNAAPDSLGGSSVLLHLSVEDADAVGRQMEAHGAKVIFPIADQFYGRREGRLQDPFGHLWIISQHLSDLSAEEIQRGVDGFSSGVA